MGRALLWWPFTAFLLVAAFPAIAVPAMVGSGVFLVVVGLVGGALGRQWRARKLRQAGRTVGAIPRAVADGSTTPLTEAAQDEKPSSDTISTDEPDEPDEPDDDGPDVRAA
ncbi:hypothetical protein [Pseudonocardia sediminis]|uniref:hypothetical protein n=1 Tax=Pseudonocardia sediminis TaxID=1397368 RepID=UPI001028C457|nr:hypothetical protein [Pseudonocardia sediminis]